VRVLVTNDDGVNAPGLEHLTRVLVERGHEVVVAAPLSEASGAGAGIGPVHTMRGGVVVTEVRLPGLENVVAFGVDALPALIVIAACLGAFGRPPDVVVSGINPGRNVGRSALHSGTVGAALTAVHFDKRALAMSIQSGPFSGFESAGDSHIHFETAALIAATLLPQVAESPPRTVVNCNVPNLPIGSLRGIRWAPLARTGLIESVAYDLAGGGRMQLDVGFGRPEAGDESDQAVTALGYVSVTPLASVSEDVRPDVSDSIRASIASTAARLGIADHPMADEVEGPAA
jgi:5'-nucleotidase